MPELRNSDRRADERRHDSRRASQPWIIDASDRRQSDRRGHERRQDERRQSQVFREWIVAPTAAAFAAQ